MSVALVELRDGALYADPGGPAPDVPAGYRRDPANGHRLVLDVKPEPCESRRERKCRHGGCRWHCRKLGLPVNPGACCRCQGLLQPLKG